MAMTVAGAPVSFGVFELTSEAPGITLPTAQQVMTSLQSDGYGGIDLGPVGFLGTPQTIVDNLSRYGLELAGGWIDLPFSDDDAFAAALGDLDAALEVFSAVLASAPSRAPLPTLADSGDAIRKANPGGGAGHALDAAGWDRLGRNVQVAADRIRERGLEPTFHHHACTFVETPAEIDEFLAHTNVGLTFDTGHLLIGGGDVTDGWRRWGSRINHLHLKDVRTDVVADIVARKGTMLDVWADGTFVPFGQGDLDVAGFLDEVVASGFDGWLVVEQDLLLEPKSAPNQAFEDSRHNREVLRRWVSL